MARLYNDITETIGHTPLVKLNRVAEEAGCVADVVVGLVSRPEDPAPEA